MTILNRRNFLRRTTQAGIAAVGLPQIVSAGFQHTSERPIPLKEGEVILFQGDSITDFGRDRNPPKYNVSNASRITTQYNDFNVLGCGYPMLASANLLLNHPKKVFKVFNKGISGNKVYQLAERWQEDCLDLKPDVLSILIGVNDYWHTLNGTYNGTAAIYRTDYKKLLDRTLQELPNIKLIIGEPFAVKNVQAVDDKWYPAFDEYRSIAKEIATEYEAAFIPYQQVFDEALSKAPAAYWTFDGVHPSVPGSLLMAEAWLKTITVKK